MIDPGTAVGIISLGIQVGDSLFKFYSKYKDLGHTISQTVDGLNTLTSILKDLNDLLQPPSTHLKSDTPLEDGSVKRVIDLVASCEELILELREECDKIQHPASQGLKGSLQFAGRRVAYPLRESTLKRLEENINALRDNILLAVNILQVRDNQQTRDDIVSVRQVVDSVAAKQLSNEVRQWLRAPDATVSHNIACGKRHAGTGSWLIQGPQYTKWLSEANSLLWLSGFAGCGKSVLCSTAIQFTFRQRLARSRTGLAFFYFAFNDIDKQDTSALLRAVLIQLSCQSDDINAELLNLYAAYKNGAPPNEVLLAYLHRSVQMLENVYLFFDALDEVPRGRQREEILATIGRIRSWSSPGLHLLITSRDEVDIRDQIQMHAHVEIAMKNERIDSDIGQFVASSLRTDTRLLKWKDHHGLIQETLAQKAQGRWAECQLETIKRCPRSVKRLEQCLNSLPRDLDETYARMLCSIDPDSFREARQILTALCYSFRPLSVEELRDIVAVDLEEPAVYDPDLRLADTDSLREICGGLIEVYRVERSEQRVRIAHFSVQEYLESPRMRSQIAYKFALDDLTGHTMMLDICLTILLSPALSHATLTPQVTVDLPACMYAAEYWHQHHRNASEDAPLVTAKVSQLFKASTTSFQNWIGLFDVGTGYRERFLWGFENRHDWKPLYYASLLGLKSVVEELIKLKHDVNASGIVYGNALGASSYRGHDEVVALLLNNGAIWSIDHEWNECMLCGAAREGHERVVRLLLDSGVDLQANGGEHARLLLVLAASAEPSPSCLAIVRLLLDKGIDVNASVQSCGSAFSALMGAVIAGNVEVVSLLLARGAKVRTRNQAGITPIDAAAGVYWSGRYTNTTNRYSTLVVM